MRELSVQEVGMVGGGNDSPPETMSVQCFVSLVAFGVSPLFGPGAVYGAAINAFTNCYGTDFTS